MTDNGHDASRPEPDTPCSDRPAELAERASRRRTAFAIAVLRLEAEIAMERDHERRLIAHE
jgi:hypothetical protein